MALQIDSGPVVQTSSLQVAIANLKTERINQMQGRACGGTGAGNIARIRRNFGGN